MSFLGVIKSRDDRVKGTEDNAQRKPAEDDGDFSVVAPEDNPRPVFAADEAENDDRNRQPDNGFEENQKLPPEKVAPALGQVFGESRERRPCPKPCPSKINRRMVEVKGAFEAGNRLDGNFRSDPRLDNRVESR